MNFWIDNAWIISIVAGSSCITAGLQFWGRGSGPKIITAVALMTALGLWAVGYGLLLHAPDLPSKLLASIVQTLGIVALPPSVFMLGLAYQGRERLITPRNVLLFHIPAMITLGLSLTNHYHHLIYDRIWLPQGSQMLALDYAPGFWLLIIIYPFSVTAWFLSQAIKALREASGPERRDLNLLLLALIPPHVGFALYYAWFLPAGAPDPSPVSFLVTALIISYGVVSARDQGKSGLDLTDQNIENNFKVQIGRSLATLAVPTITYFLMVEITHGNLVEIALLGAMLATTLSVLVAVGLTVSLETTRRYFRIGLAIFVIVFGLLDLKLLVEQGNQGQVLWALIFPLVALLAFGGGWGLTASGLFLAGSLTYAHAVENPQHTLIGQFGLRFLVTYSVITLIFFIVDRKRRQFLAETMEQRDALDLAGRQWRLTFDAMSDAVCLVDDRHRILRCNRAAVERFGRDGEDIPGNTCFQVIHQNAAPAEDCPQRRARETGTRQERILPSGGRWYREVADPIPDKTGAVTGFVHIVSDITKQKVMEDEAAWLNRQLAQAQKRESLGIVAGGVAHDFNNLLNGILGYNDLAKQSLPEGSPAREHLDAITSLGMKAAVLTRKMLDYTGHGKRISKTVDISRLLEEMRIALRSSAPGHIGLEFSLTSGLPPARVDTTQLAQAVTNLVVNAAEAIGEADGRITISTGSAVCSLDELRATGFYEDQQPGVYVFVEVADSGPGLDPEILDRIFDPFFTTKFPGRGLGLATISGIIRSHQGAVRVVNTPGEGAAFRLLLPAVEDQ